MTQAVIAKTYETVWLPLDQIIPYENNPRKINDAAVNAVAQSIKDVGWRAPILLDKDHVIIYGHTRLKAAKKLKHKTAPCWIADDLTPDQVQRYRITDNKSGTFSIWDLDLLPVELAKTDLSLDVITANFSPVDLETYLGSTWVQPPAVDKVESVERPADPEKPKTHSIKLTHEQYILYSLCASKIREFEPELTDGQVLQQILEQHQQRQL